MVQSWRHWSRQLGLVSSLAIGGALVFLGDYALAQITRDTTLGPESSSVTRNVLIKGLPSDQIKGGAKRGANLFHSFQEFNIDEGRGAYFTNPAGIENILGRVTGKNRSDIQGTLGVLGKANLFLINPNGVIFGPNASLDISGSFVATTANGVRLGDAGLFSASEPETSNLLTVRPSALFFNALAAQNIVNQSQAQSLSGETNSLDGPVGLQVPAGQTLALVGGNVLLEEGNLTSAGGRIELGSVAGVGEVGLSQSGNNWSLGYDQVDDFGDIRLEGGASIDVSGEGGGNLQIQSAQLEMTQGSYIFADTLGPGDGGEVLVRTTEEIALRDGSLITADVLGSGTGGDLNIATERLTVQGGARVSASTFGKGKGGNLSVDAQDVQLIGESADGEIASGLFAQTEGDGDAGTLDGDAGNLTIATGRLTVQDGGAVSASTGGTGDGGALSVTASNAVEVIGESADGLSVSGLFAQTEGDGDAGTLDGDAGNLTIATGRLTVQDGGAVSASTGGTGAGRNLNVTADVVEIIGESATLQSASNLSAQTEGDGDAGTLDGDAGNLTIATGRLTVQDGGVVSASTFGTGDGGALSVTASDAVEVIGTDGEFISSLTAQTEGDGNPDTLDGDAGDLTINTGHLTVQDGGVVSASTFGTGDGGALSVTASDAVEVIGRSADGQIPGGLFAQTQGDGDARDLTITTGQLTVQDGATVDVSSIGSGDAGNLGITARSIRLDKKATLSSGTRAGEGNITLDSQDLLLSRGSSITTDARGTATGGNINIDTDVLVALENSDIRANALEGLGGRVSISSQGIFGTEFREDETPQSDITATSELGPEFSGTVELNTPDVDPSQGVVALPEEVVDVSGLVAQKCPAGGGTVAKRASKFVVTGRGGLPPDPSDPPSSDVVLANWITLDPKMEEPRSDPAPTTNPTTEAAPIVEAQGWVRDSKGQVVLTAQAPKVTPHSSGLNPAGCPGS